MNTAYYSKGKFYNWNTGAEITTPYVGIVYCLGAGGHFYCWPVSEHEHAWVYICDDWRTE